METQTARFGVLRNCGAAAVAVLFFAAMGATARDALAFSENPPECTGLSWSQRVAIVPANPRSGDPITVCMLGMVIAESVNVSRTGNQITVTVIDTGMDWMPNPEIVVAETLGTLPVGAYLLDARVQAPDSSLQSLATGLALDVVGVAPIPALGIPAYLLLAAVVGLSGWAISRRRRVFAA